MAEFNLREFYKNGLLKMELGKCAQLIMSRVVANDDQGADFEHALQNDRFFTTVTINQASAALKKGEVKSLSHAVVLLGKEVVRGFVLGHTLRRLYDTNADIVTEDLINKSKSLVKRAVEAEELATKLKCEYSGLAFAAGYTYDIFEQRLMNDQLLNAKFGPLFEQTWKHSMRTAGLCWAFSSHERIQVNLKRVCFAAGLLHDSGKLALALSYPEQYEPILKKFEEAKINSPDDDASQVQIELADLGISHTEAGSFMFFALDHLHDLEGVVDYHHDFSVLRTRSSDLFILATVLNIADRLAFLMETDSKLESPSIKKILEPHKGVFPLNAEEVQSLMASLRSKGLIS